VPFWYSRFPELSSDQIRNNALIHSGAGLARTASESEEWLRCFGSMPRVENRIESDEVQAIVFRGMKRLPYSTCLAVKLPPKGEALGEWLSWVRGKAMRPDGLGDASGIAALETEGVLLPVPRPAGRSPEYALAHALTIAFGDRPLTGDDQSAPMVMQAVTNPEYDPEGKARRDAEASASHAVFLGLSAAGVAKFEARRSLDGSLIDGFPYAYRMGMAGRDRILGDVGQDSPELWRWGDDPRSTNATEAALLLYAATPQKLGRLVAVHQALLQNHGGIIQSQTDCAPAWAEAEKADFEHFGYRDGISQPVMRGTSRSMRGVPDRDIVEPGEFILGYKNGQGFYPPSPLLPPESDARGALPVAVAGLALSRYPDFGDASLTDGPRDLGRNGSFLVLRELKQDVAGFEAFVDQAAKDLSGGGLCDLYKLVGQHPDKEWVKAKLMGRWPNGRPLIGNPVNIASASANEAAERENDFSYGEEDSQGLACPFGSHIRRTNPRDSKQPGDQAEQFISNRHRLLRRGRNYTRMDSGEKGLLFASLCTDIERQFEFVQQFWANAPAFHGLDKEPDPFIGSDPVRLDGGTHDRVYTIPTPAGPVQLNGMKKFVQTMGGGYFFLPSRSALGWLTDVALSTAGAGSKENIQ
jgi:deferrochelatase/peroxidase EfeB